MRNKKIGQQADKHMVDNMDRNNDSRQPGQAIDDLIANPFIGDSIPGPNRHRRPTEQHERLKSGPYHLSPILAVAHQAQAQVQTCLTQQPCSQPANCQPAQRKEPQHDSETIDVRSIDCAKMQASRSFARPRVLPGMTHV